MLFLNPLSLLWLLLLAPVIIFFYLLKLRRRTVTVSSVFLWSALTQDMQANAPFQRLKKNLLLFLQLLLACLLVFALARPYFEGRSRGGDNVVIVLDGSASMQSRDARGSRFDAARSTATEMINRMHGADRMMLLLVTDRAERLTSFTSDRRLLRAALDQARPADTEANLKDALELAISAGGTGVSNASSRIYILSDGAFPDLGDINPRGCELQFIKHGERSDNLGIVAADVRRPIGQPDAFEMFVAIRNYSPTPRSGSLGIYRDEGLLAVRKIELPAPRKETGYSETALTLNDLPVRTGTLRLELDVEDDLSVDNVAYVALAPRRKLRVLLVSEGNLYLERALVVDDDVQLDRVSPSGYTGQPGYDVVVFENSGPRQPGPGNHLYINCAGPTAPVTLDGKVRDVSVIDWDRVHPAMRYVRLSQLYMPEAHQAKLRPWGVELAEHEEGPLIALGEKGGVRSAYIGFDLLKTDLPLRVAFPILMTNLLQWLVSESSAAETRTVRSGQPFSIAVGQDVREALLKGPGGMNLRLPAEGGAIHAPGVDRVGLYTLTAGDKKWEFAANLLSRSESATAPRNEIELGRRPLLASGGYVRTTLETWRWLALLALVVLGLEWWIYHRRL